MESVTLFPLDVRGNEYVESCLKQGRSLSRAVMQHVFRGGTTYAPLPRNIGNKSIYDFESGRLMPSKPSYECFVDLVTQSQVGEADFSVILEDPWITKSDILRRPLDEATRFAGESVCYLLNSISFNVDELEKLIKLPASFLFIGFVSQPVQPNHDTSERMLSPRAIEAFVQGCIMIFVSAYDQEGLVIWRR